MTGPDLGERGFTRCPVEHVRQELQEWPPPPLLICHNLGAVSVRVITFIEFYI